MGTTTTNSDIATSATVTEDDAQYALDLVSNICAQVGPGVPGSLQEWQRAKRIEEELASHLGARNVAVEEFTFAPAPFLASLPISAVFMLIAVGLAVATARVSGGWLWLGASASLALCVAAATLVFLEFIADFEFIDRLFAKQRSVNVIGTLRKPGAHSVKRVLLVSGHHDSAPEGRWFSLLGFGGMIFGVIWALGLVATIVLSLMHWVGVVTGNAAIVQIGPTGWVVIALLIVPAAIYALFFNTRTTGGGTVPGAADNLAASAVVVATSRYFATNPASIPEDTEIRFVSFGAEEAGTRGSRRYVEQHADELRRADARLLNFEIIADPELGILTSDFSGTVKHAPEVVSGVVGAAERTGVPFKVRPASIGVGTDAGPFSRARLKAAAVLGCGLRHQSTFYHQPRDGPEVLSEEPVLNALRLTVEWIRSRGE